MKQDFQSLRRFARDLLPGDFQQIPVGEIIALLEAHDLRGLQIENISRQAEARGDGLHLRVVELEAQLASGQAQMIETRAKAKWHMEHIRLGNDIISNHCIAMQAALIEQSIGKGDEAALEWISNTLDGPGLLPSCAEAAHLPDAKEKGPAQAWLDGKTAEHEAMRARQDVEHGKAVKL